MFTGGFKLYVVPFTDLQLYLLENVPHDKLTIFLKSHDKGCLYSW